ncbi:hypothetical protein BJ165DRAFT_714621 [Panaeolus papilionaceus]|nr:hypothetical protein BJ165DRAFT_714621 [Panaeolus papilionaceus]
MPVFSSSLTQPSGSQLPVEASSPSSSSPYSPRSSLPTPLTPASATHLMVPSPVMAGSTSLLLQPEANEGGRYTHREQLQLFREALTLPMDNAGEFVPQQMYKPHTTSDRKRYVEEVLLDPPLYFYTEHPDQCGISLKDALQFRTKNLRDRDMVVFQNRGPSVSIRLEWPGYRQWSRQIPTKDFRSPPGPITLAKLAKNVAKCVQRFMQDRKSLPMEEDGNPLWRIGDGPDDIRLEDLVLVSIHHVSLGSWQPQLRLIRPRRQHFHHAPTVRPTQMSMPMNVSPQMSFPLVS